MFRSHSKTGLDLQCQKNFHNPGVKKSAPWTKYEHEISYDLLTVAELNWKGR